MKKVNKLSVILLIALAALLAVSVFGLAGGKTAAAESYDYYYDDPYSYYFEDYDVTYDISENREIAVTEIIAVRFTGRDSTGIIKDIPVNGGELVRNIEVYELIGGEKEKVYYDVYIEDSDFISVDIGDFSNKTGEVRTYMLTYDYCLTKAQEGENALFLNAIGIGRGCEIVNARVTVILPSGYKSGVYILNADGERTFVCPQPDQNNAIVINVGYLEEYQGVTFELQFEDGVLSTFSDPTPYLFMIPAFILLAVIIILKLFVFNKNYLTPVVNYEAPNKMDPLIMGKLIDNKVNKEDVTSLIYYWASKGYIKINLDDKDDPSIIRILQHLPESSPDYERLMYESMFKRDDVVKPSQLKNNFYKTVEQVTAIVNKRTNKLYDNKSVALSYVFTVLCGLLLVIAPMVLALTQISGKFFYWAAIAILVPVILINMLTQTLLYYRLKLKKVQLIGFSIGIALLCVVAGAFYVLIIPSSIMSLGAKIAVFAVCSPAYVLSAILIMRTKEYTQKLNDVIGFKNFIMLAEKDQLEMMLEDDPQFYYNILPYAQVLGVTDKWEEKFKDITVQPPQWASGNVLTTYLEFRVINSILRSSMGNISTGMISRPSSAGKSGGFSGGFSGGHAGGGHGGGGFRGR